MGRAKFISQLITDHGWKSGVELGVWRGKTFKYLAETHPKLLLWGVDLYAPQPDNTGPEKWTPGENGHDWNHEEYLADMSNFCRSRNNCTMLHMSTDQATGYFIDSSVDFVFIDADHSFEGVRKDIDNWLPKIKSGGYLIGHDIDWQGVKDAVELKFKDKYHIGPDNCWYFKVT